jgi:carbonic anhydrase
LQIAIAGETYQLRQFHFHAPSEHTEDNQQYPLEMHLVHRNAADALAVVGLFIVEGAENAAFAPVWNQLPAEENQPRAATIDVGALLPADKTFYTYSGSLTTPPCLENVRWLVMNTPVEMSAGQIAAFTAIISGNNRPLQASNDREVALDETR